MMERVEQQLGNYRLKHLLGRGAFADVYLGEHLYLSTPVAVKVLHSGLDSHQAGRFSHRGASRQPPGASAHHSRLRLRFGERRPFSRDGLRPQWQSTPETPFRYDSATAHYRHLHHGSGLCLTVCP